VQTRDEERVTKEFRKRQSRQIVAMAIVLFLVLLAAVVHKRPDIFGEISRPLLFAAQAVGIALFIGFTSMNWRCPACGKYLGGDIYRRFCRKCGARLQ
jgi:DMSO reductase anchor subunit